MSKVYIISTIDFDYNDEYMYSHEGEPGHPKYVYSSQEKAEAECLKLNINELRGCDISGYSEDAGTLFDNVWTEDYKKRDKMLDSNWETICDIFAYPEESDEGYSKENNPLNNYSDWSIPEDATDEQIIKLMELINLRFYQIVELDMGD